MVHGAVLLKPPVLSNALSNVLPKSTFSIPTSDPHALSSLPQKQMYTGSFAPSKIDSGYGYEYGYGSPSKYEELFSNPNPQYFGFSGSLSVYPVDTMIPQVSPGSSLKHEAAEVEISNSPGASNIAQKSMGSSELENLLSGKADTDFSAVLSLLEPTNKDKDTQAFNFIPSDTDLGSLYSLQPLDAIPPAIPPDGQMGIGFWESLEKEVPKELVKIPQEPSPVSDTSSEDPFISAEHSPQFEEHRLQDIFLELNRSGQSTPLIQSPEYPLTESLLSASSDGSNWSEQLEELFQRTIGFDSDFMLPPSPKRLHEDSPPYSNPPSEPSNSLASSAYFDGTSLSQAPSPAPSSPEQKPQVFSPPQPPIDKTGERGGRGKGTLLFGKHEDEIIHKLLTPRLGAPSKPITRDKLVAMPVEEFNQLLELCKLSEIEVAFMKEWRRRGKNKTAAQIARKRKRDELVDLDAEVEVLRRQKVEQQKKYDRLRSEIATLKERTMRAEDEVYQRYSRKHKSAVSRNTHTIHVTEDGKVVLLPRISSRVLLFK